MSPSTVRSQSVCLYLAAIALSACGGGSDEPASSPTEPARLRRFAFGRAGIGDVAPSVELAGHLEPGQGVDTWEVIAPEWIFEDSGARKRPLRLAGQGKKLVTIPGPFELESFDRITAMVENPVHGSMLVTVKMEGGEELQARADVLKGRHRHPVTFKLPRYVDATETISSLVLYFDLKRAVTLHGVDFVRQPMLATVPSPETGAALVQVGTSAHRAVGLGPTQTLSVGWSGGKGMNATIWIAGLPSDEAWSDDDAVVNLMLAQSEPFPGEQATASVTRSVSLLPGWTPVTFLGLAAGSYTLEASMEFADESTVALMSELAVAGPPAESPGTVLLMTSDTHRADHLGLTNPDAGKPIETPHLDALAAKGVLFESAWTTSNTTIPSHSALLTGRHPRDTKVLGNYSSLGSDPEFSPGTLAEAFAAKGYATVAVISSSHLSDKYSGLGRGFDVVIQPDGSESRAAQSVQAVLAQLRGGTPTFVWLHLFDAHGPYLPPPAFDRRYYPKDKNPFDPTLPEIDLDGGRMPLWLRGLRDHGFPRAQYRAEIAYMDSQIGVLMESSRVAAGLIAFTSDHGEVFARNGVFYEHKGLTPDTLRVPLIVSGPSLDRAGERVAVPVRQMDVGRTLLNLAGYEGAEFPGSDLLADDLLEDEPSYAVSRRFASVTQGKWHSILTLSDLSDSKDGRWAARHQIEVYDISVDPDCKKDLAREEIEVATRYRKAIVEWLAAEDVMLRASRPNLDKSAKMNLAALGYGGDDGPKEALLYDASCSCSECLKFK